MYAITEIRQRIDGMYAHPESDEAQEVIHDDSTHVTEVWQDGEITITKSGDLYRQRNLHQSEKPFLPVNKSLFAEDDFESHDEWYKVWRGDKDARRVVIDDELLDILAEYREFVVTQQVIEKFR